MPCVMVASTLAAGPGGSARPSPETYLDASLTASARATNPAAANAQQAMLRFAQCMRSHGVVNFPDPQAGGALELAQKVAHANTPRFKAAQHACQKLVPGAPIPTAHPGANATP